MWTTSALSVHSEVDGPTAIVRLRGELDVTTAGDLRRCLRRLLGDDVVDIRLDVSGVAFVDATGVGAIVGGHQAACRAGGQLLLCRPTREIRRALELTGLADVVAVEADAGEGTAVEPGTGPAGVDPPAGDRSG
jgi:anti-sigma B factor antagonist